MGPSNQTIFCCEYMEGPTAPAPQVQLRRRGREWHFGPIEALTLLGDGHTMFIVAGRKWISRTDRMAEPPAKSKVGKKPKIHGGAQEANEWTDSPS